jgi:aminoglycoside phosphotransferase (APT) family kinase protein
MHSDQVDITVDDVARIVAEQVPEWRSLSLRVVPSHGTVNALFRLGDEIVLRFPLKPSRSGEFRAGLVAEQEHARRIAPHVPLLVPEPLAIGEPSDIYPGPWTAYRWIPGETASHRTVDDFDALARDLAEFVRALHAIDTGGRQWSGSGRGGPLRPYDDDVRRALAASTHLVDTGRLERLWTRCLGAPPHADPGVWAHTDLMPGNLLVRDGRLVAVIDLEGVAVGDPAVDLMPAWNLLPPGPRETYRQALGTSRSAWVRGRAWALVQAVIALPYYTDTNPAMADTALHTLEALIDESDV